MRLLKAAGWLAVPVLASVAWRRYDQTVRELDAVSPASPVLPGTLHALPTPWGVAAYRLIKGSSDAAPLVVVHGWGRTGDSAWWPLLWETDRTVLVVDLPGHGRSSLYERFQFGHAADAVVRAVKDAELEQPILVGHSMGGPVALHALRHHRSLFSGLVMVASSAFWVKPRLWVTVAAAPFVMAPRSPVVVRKAYAEMRQKPDRSSHIRWTYSSRPERMLLAATATELRTFDARDWDDFELPPAVWVVATEDGVIHPRHQRDSAAHFGVDTIDVESDHAVVINLPHSVLEAVAHLEQRLADTSGPERGVLA